jgi:predicted phosphodiesterase
MTEHLKWLVASDLHFPKHDPRTVELLLKVIKKWQPDAIDLAGDIDDAECSSRWVEGTPAETYSVQSGAKPVKDFLKTLRDLCPNSDMHYHCGNHDYYRHKKYMEKNAPGMAEFITPDTLYGVKDSGFAWHEYEKPPVERLGGIYVHHGEAISKHSAQSVMNDVQNYMVPLIRGHSHRAGAYFVTYPLAGIDIESYEIGHMTMPELHTYQTTHNWQQAFLTAHVVDGVAHCSLNIIKDHTVFVDGEFFQA